MLLVFRSQESFCSWEIDYIAGFLVIAWAAAAGLFIARRRDFGAHPKFNTRRVRIIKAARPLSNNCSTRRIYLQSTAWCFLHN